MRKFTIDFTAENTLPDGSVLGKQGEHNATELIIKPPAEMLNYPDLSYISIVFSRGTQRVSSDAISAKQEISFILSGAFTTVSVVSVQLEGFDGNNNLLVKSDRIEDLIFEGGISGEEYTGSDEIPMQNAVRQNTAARHTHENKDVLDGLSAEGESLMFNGKGIGGGAEIDLELLPAQIVASLLSKANVTTVFGTPEEISADDSYMNFFYSTSMDSYLVCVPSESGKLIYMNGDTFEFTEEMMVNKGNLIIFWFNNEMQLSNTTKGGEFLRQLLVDGIESVTSES